MGPLAGILTGVALAAPAAALACAYPDEGTLPLRRAVTRVQMLPETQAWAAEMHRAGALVTYAVLLGDARRAGGRCYWTVEVRAANRLWKRFYVTPDGRDVTS